jgi:hypothetical protein
MRESTRACGSLPVMVEIRVKLVKKYIRNQKKGIEYRMSTQWDSNGTTFEQAPTGNHLGILVKIIDIGTQEGEYAGQKTLKRQNILTWELPNKHRDDGQPFIISKFYTASIGEKANLTKDLTSWLGKAPARPFDPKSLLGKPCQLTVVEREKTGKHVVSTVTGLMEGTPVPDKPHNELVFFSLDDFNEEVFNNLSQGLQTMIMKSPEYAKIINGEVEDVNQAMAATDDIPF